MPKKIKTFYADLNPVPANQIYLNISNLEPGDYLLKLTHNNKVIKHVTFKK